jgi:hypothetical protein
MPDVNYYLERQGAVNIFEVMKGNNRSLLTNDVLPKHNFNFTSCLDKINKFKVYFVRDLSKAGRSFVYKRNISKSVRLEMLNSY